MLSLRNSMSFLASAEVICDADSTKSRMSRSLSALLTVYVNLFLCTELRLFRYSPQELGRTSETAGSRSMIWRRQASDSSFEAAVTGQMRSLSLARAAKWQARG